jgi:hypothetical protein
VSGDYSRFTNRKSWKADVVLPIRGRNMKHDVCGHLAFDDFIDADKGVSACRNLRVWPKPMVLHGNAGYGGPDDDGRGWIDLV